MLKHSLVPFVLVVTLVAVRLESMMVPVETVVIPANVEPYLKELEINLAILDEKKKDELSEIITKAYRRLALKYHPDKERGDKERFIKIKEAYDNLTNWLNRGKSKESPEALKKRMKEARDNADEIMATITDEGTDAEDARNLYTKAIGPFLEDENFGYAFDLLGVAYADIVKKYFEENDEYTVAYGREYILTCQNIMNKVEQEKKKQGPAYFKNFNLKGYNNPELAYNSFVKNFKELKTTVKSAFDELKKDGFNSSWKELQQAVQSGNAVNIFSELIQMADYLNYEVKFNGTEYIFLNDEQKNYFIKAYLGLADAWIKNNLLGSAIFDLSFAYDLKEKFTLGQIKDLAEKFQEIQQAIRENFKNDAMSTQSAIDRWANMCYIYFPLMPADVRDDNFFFEMCNKVIERYESIGNFEIAYKFVQNELKDIPEFMEKYKNYTVQINALKQKEQELRAKLEKIEQTEQKTPATDPKASPTGRPTTSPTRLQDEKNLLESFNQLIRSFSTLQSKLTIS